MVKRVNVFYLFSPKDIQLQKLLIDSSISSIERKQSHYIKLQQMIELVYSNDCYRKGILNYFGEVFENKCNNRSNCLYRGIMIYKTESEIKIL